MYDPMMASMSGSDPHTWLKLPFLFQFRKNAPQISSFYHFWDTDDTEKVAVRRQRSQSFASDLRTMSLTRFLPVIESTAFLLCDVQERFRPLIYNMNTVIHKSELMNNVCHALDIPCYISEQNPKALGTTVTEITRYPSTYIYPKTKFSMITDDLRTRIVDKKQVYDDEFLT